MKAIFSYPKSIDCTQPISWTDESISLQSLFHPWILSGYVLSEENNDDYEDNYDGEGNHKKRHPKKIKPG